MDFLYIKKILLLALSIAFIITEINTFDPNSGSWFCDLQVYSQIILTT